MELEIYRGDFTVIMGSSGAGKSTLLYMLSGGEAQRCAMVRALINDPDVVFADEPTGALNSAGVSSVLNVLTDINNSGQSVVMVTHDIKSARRGNRIIYLKDGRIEGELRLPRYVSGDKVRHAKVKDFLEDMGW